MSTRITCRCGFEGDPIRYRTHRITDEGRVRRGCEVHLAMVDGAERQRRARESERMLREAEVRREQQLMRRRVG